MTVIDPSRSESNRPRPLVWRIKGRELAITRPIVFGILNVTPDSFSDGGHFDSEAEAIVQVERMISEGADGIDVGGESTRPQGARRVSVAEELRRVIPVLSEIRSRFPQIPISVDTTKSEVASMSLHEGADIVNDVSGFRMDARMGEIAAEAGAGVVLMHSRGGVEEMGTYRHAEYSDDVTGDVLGELEASLRRASDAGVAAAAIVLDPGIGFAKRSEHSLRILAELERLLVLGCPLMVGVSRKRFIGELSGVADARERVAGSMGANVAALMRGARLFRVHDVAPNREALDVAWGVLRAGDRPTNGEASGRSGSRFLVPGSHRT